MPAAPAAPAPSAPALSSLAGVVTDPQSQTATRGRNKKGKQPPVTAAAAPAATASSSTTAISADSINSLQFPPGIPGIPGLPPADLPAQTTPVPNTPLAEGNPAAKMHTKYFSKIESADPTEAMEAAIEAGKAAMKDRDYEKATAYFKRASDLGPQTGKQRFGSTSGSGRSVFHRQRQAGQ